MTNQSSILNDHNLKEFARMAMNIILEKIILTQQEILGCFIFKKNSISNDFSLANENVFNITPFISF